MTDNKWADALRSNQPISEAIKAARENAPGKPVGSELQLPALTVGRGYRYGNLTWFPIFTDAPVAERSYATAAVAAGKVTVVEHSTPTVGQLQVQNQLAQPVLLFEGALLEGGWQHRAITKTIWVDANAQVPIPVVCVEAGRWQGGQGQDLGDKIAPARVRAAMRGMHRDQTGAVHQSAPDQQLVWSEVQNFARVTAKAGPTHSLVEMAQQLEQDIAGMQLTPVTPLFGQRGILVAMAGKPIALEVFDHPETLNERIQGILDAYLPESLTQPYEECLSGSARGFVARTERMGVQPTGDYGRFRNGADKYVASEAVANSKGEFLHLFTLNAHHKAVLAS